MTLSDPVDTAARARLVGLMQATAARDEAAFKALYTATQAKLYGIVLRILGDRDMAAEILQEAYVKIWERAGDFDASRASPITWMATIARNRALDEARRRRPERDEGEDLDKLAAELPHPLDGRERSEALANLLACLDGLERERRELVLLAYYRGLSRDALSRRFGRPVPTIKTLLYRSLAQLRGCLDGRA